MSKHTDKYLVGFTGWRRKCLLFVLSILLAVVVINLVLTLWMVKVLYFSANGLGALKINRDGVHLASDALIIDRLIASKMTTRKGHPLRVESTRNVSLLSAGHDGRVYSKLFLGDDRFEMSAPLVKITDPSGHPIFMADKREVVFGADAVHFVTEGGTVVHGSVQTPLVRPDAGQNLRLEAPTKNVNIFALHGVNIESRAGDITSQALNDVKIQSRSGSLKLDSANVYFPKMPAPNDNRSGSRSSSRPKPTVYQVCVCGKGRLFLAPPEGPCTADNDVCR